MGEPIDQEEVELTEEQLMELLQNAQNLPIEQQMQLQMILKEKMKEDIKNDRVQSYQNIFNILTDNILKAKHQLSKLGEVQ